MDQDLLLNELFKAELFFSVSIGEKDLFGANRTFSGFDMSVSILIEGSPAPWILGKKVYDRKLACLRKADQTIDRALNWLCTQDAKDLCIKLSTLQQKLQRFVRAMTQHEKWKEVPSEK